MDVVYATNALVVRTIRRPTSAIYGKEVCRRHNSHNGTEPRERGTYLNRQIAVAPCILFLSFIEEICSIGCPGYGYDFFRNLMIFLRLATILHLWSAGMPGRLWVTRFKDRLYNRSCESRFSLYFYPCYKIVVDKRRHNLSELLIISRGHQENSKMLSHAYLP